ncbi:stress response protein nst1 [Rhypophila sp. PSN 637]
MSQPPPPPPPHGENPKTTAGGSGLPPGKYDIFIIPEHSAGSGFLYLPSLKPQWNSFIAGVATTLMAVVIGQSIAPAIRAWWAGFQGIGNAGLVLLMLAIGLGAWALGKSQSEKGPSSHSQSHGGSQQRPGGAFNHSGGFYTPPPNGTPPPNTGPQAPPPPPPPHSEAPRSDRPNPGQSWQEAPRPEPRPQPQPQHQPPPPPPPQPEPQRAPEPEPEPPKPKPQPQPQPQAAPKPQPAPTPPPPRPSPTKTETPKGAWEKAREETRRREEERKAKEADNKRREEAARRLRELREKDAREREKREQEARERETRERLRKEQEAREKEKLEKELREKVEKELREKVEREAREKAEREAREKEEARKREEERARVERERQAARERDAKERAERLRKEEEEKNNAGRKGSTYAFSSVGEKTSMWPNGRPPAPPSSAPGGGVRSPAASPRPAAAPSPSPSPTKPASQPARSATGTEDTYSYRPYDKPKKPTARKKSVSDFSESSWAPSTSTARTTPPPSVREPYTTNDPNKIVIKAVYGFLNQFSKTPASQLVSGVGTVTDGLILRINSAGLFVDDDIRNVPQREWDVKAWTIKLVETGEWKPKGLHLLRVTMRDQEGKRHLFVISEEESWKIARGLQQLRSGSQVRALNCSGFSGMEAKNVLETLGWG